MESYGNLACPVEMAVYIHSKLINKPNCDVSNYEWTYDHCKLHRFHPHRFLSMIKNKIMVLIGDSIARQHYISLICSIQSLASPLLSEQHIAWDRLDRIDCPVATHCDIPDILCLTFEYNVTICFQRWHSFLKKSTFKDLPLIKDGLPLELRKNNHISNDLSTYVPDIILINGGGIHFNYDYSLSSKMNTNIQEEYKSKLQEVITYAQENDFFLFGNNTSYNNVESSKKVSSSRLMIYRETAGQAFRQDPFYTTLNPPQVANGDFAMRIKEDKQCLYEPLLFTNQSLSRKEVQTWRVKLEQMMMKDVGIPFLPVYDMSITLPCAGLGYVGPDKNSYLDCTHYYLPGIPDEWNTLLYAHLESFFKPK